MTKTCPDCDATVHSTSQPNRMGTTPEMQKMYDDFDGLGWREYMRGIENGNIDPTGERLRAICKLAREALAATPAVGGEAVPTGEESMTKPIMEEALDEIRRSGRLDIQERVFAKMKPNDPLADLVAVFSKALLEKLRAAEAKYGYKNDWQRPDWETECQKHLAQHLAKGDPRDVAAYAAFCWYHGWSTAP